MRGSICASNILHYYMKKFATVLRRHLDVIERSIERVCQLLHVKVSILDLTVILAVKEIFYRTFKNSLIDSAPIEARSTTRGVASSRYSLEAFTIAGYPVKTDQKPCCALYVAQLPVFQSGHLPTREIPPYNLHLETRYPISRVRGSNLSTRPRAGRIGFLSRIFTDTL